MITLADIQRRVGVEADGKWGPRTLAAVAKALGIEAPAPRTRRLHNSAAFFTEVRKVTGRLDQRQVDSINLILQSATHWSTAWMAYALATTWHECRFRPIKEQGGNAYLQRMYDIRGARPWLAERMGNVNPGDGIRFAGRGFVQLTWRSNYRNAGRALGVDLEGNPDLALEPNVAARVLVWGMEGGHFTGHSLSRHLPRELGTIQQFIEARRIINGTDRAADIAEFAADFQTALNLGGWSQ
jgi:putative chitinase